MVYRFTRIVVMTIRVGRQGEKSCVMASITTATVRWMKGTTSMVGARLGTNVNPGVECAVMMTGAVAPVSSTMQGVSSSVSLFCPFEIPGGFFYQKGIDVLCEFH